MRVEQYFVNNFLEVKRPRREPKHGRIFEQQLKYIQKHRALADAGGSQDCDSFALFQR
jgi:hypothetical protein